MMRPVPQVAVRRRLAVLYLPGLVLTAAVFLANAMSMNSGTVFGGLGLLVVGFFAVVDLERNA